MEHVFLREKPLKLPQFKALGKRMQCPVSWLEIDEEGFAVYQISKEIFSVEDKNTILRYNLFLRTNN